VTGRITDNSIVVSVEDDGVGIPSQKLEDIYKNMNSETSNLDGNFALVNCHKRIRLYYGDGYGLELKSTENKGTSAIIRIPCEICSNDSKTETAM
jgi:Putative regulator of cell autolysis